MTVAEAVRGGTATLLVKIDVLAASGAFGADPPWEIAEIDKRVEAYENILDDNLLMTVIDDRASAALTGLQRNAASSAAIDTALAPLTARERAIITDEHNLDEVDPAPYLAALRQLIDRKRSIGQPGDGPTTASGTIVAADLTVAFDGFDLNRFLKGPAMVSPNAGPPVVITVPGSTSVVTQVVAQPASGPPPAALVGAAAGLALVVALPVTLVVARRRRGDAAPGVSAQLIEASRRLVAVSDEAALRQAAAEELRLLVGASWARFVEVDGDGVPGDIDIRDVAPGSAVPSLGGPGDADLVAAVVADAVATRATVSQPAVAPRGDGSGGQPAVLATPVLQDDAVVGVLLAAREPTPAFGDHEREAAERFASILVSAIDTVGRLSSLETLAGADPLTGLGNRRAFDRAIADALARAEAEQRPVCLLMIDVDHFKSVNDRFGHAVGDDVLKGVAADLSASLRGTDRAYRYGGEEFCVLLHDDSATVGDAARIAERLRETIEAHDWTEIVPDGSLRTTASFGLAVGVGGAPAELQLRADDAVYAAKHRGRNRVVIAGT